MLKDGKNVVYMEVNTKSGFENAWNAIGDDANEVMILSHSSERSLIFEQGSSTEAYSVNGKNLSNGSIGNITKLDGKDINSLIILSCNAGNIAQATGTALSSNTKDQGNVAQAFLKVDGIDHVIAYDGNLGYGYDGIGSIITTILGNYYPRESNDQSLFHEISGGDAVPQGAVQYNSDGTYEVLGW